MIIRMSSSSLNYKIVIEGFDCGQCWRIVQLSVDVAPGSNLVEKIFFGNKIPLASKQNVIEQARHLAIPKAFRICNKLPFGCKTADRVRNKSICSSHMPSTAQKGARSRLADVLADIKESKNEDDCNTRPMPAKRRSAVNYVALSGHTPRQSRSSAASSSNSTKANNTNSIASPNRNKTFVLKFVDNSIDLAQFLTNHKAEQSLYPLVRAWAQIQKSSPNGDPTGENREEPSNSPHLHSQEEGQSSPHQVKVTNRKPPTKRKRTDVDIICSNLLLSARQHQIH